MPFKSTADVVNAVVTSTEAYERFLRDQRMTGGVARHRAVNIQPCEDGNSLFENSQWQNYRCNLPPRLNIRSDASVTLIPDTAPEPGIEIWIREYDRRTGQAVFSAREPVQGNAGNVIIDFLWLVKRCLKWFRQRGATISDLNEFRSEIPATANVFLQPEGISNEQAGAIRMILERKLSYIWGPPGTGKTKCVLAKAARHCTDNGQKILVLASTNLAVDNALTAILAEGVPGDKVTRIGIPSKAFIESFPECCEERAFQSEIRQTQSQIRVLEDNIAALEKVRQLTKRICDKSAAQDDNYHKVTSRRAELGTIEKKLAQVRLLASQAREELKAAASRLDLAQRELGNLSMPTLLADISTLESEQTGIIRHRQTLENQLRNVGLLRSLFTRKKHELKDLILKETTRLHLVETTLSERRKKRDETAPIVSALEKKIASLTLLHEEARRWFESHQKQVLPLESKLQALQAEIETSDLDARRLQTEITAAKTELSSLDGRFHAENAEAVLADWRNQIRELQERLTRYKQDLSGKSVLGATLDGFMGLTMQIPIEVDRVFIDEAPYAPLAKVLPVLSLHCPIAMLGDHLQLPPVCECQNNSTIRAYWAKPSIFIEDAFRFGAQWAQLEHVDSPGLEIMQRSILKQSYRFGQSLAGLLDRHIYGDIGLTGLNPEDTDIRQIDCEPRENPNRNNRENEAEADKIMDSIEIWWHWAQQNHGELPNNWPTLAVLTPYKNQRDLIRKKLNARFHNSHIRDHVEVWNTHQAQGREWDWVLFSVSDTGRLQGNDPFFSDSSSRDGKPLINTTISRAKHQLRVFLDAGFWKQRTPNSILSELARLG